jgi:hypothetical protein
MGYGIWKSYENPRVWIVGQGLSMPTPQPGNVLEYGRAMRIQDWIAEFGSSLLSFHNQGITQYSIWKSSENPIKRLD